MQWLRHGASDEGYCDTEMRWSTMLKRKMFESRYKKDKKTDRETGQRAGRQKSGVRGFAFLLCLMLCMEEASLTVQATEPFVSADGSQNENSDSLHEDETPEDPAGGTDTTPGEPDGNSDDEGEKTKTPGGSASEEGAESETPDGGEGQEPPGEEAKPGSDSADEDGEKIPGSEPEEGAESEGPEEETEPQESVSENSLDTVSENTLETISENSLDAERQALIRQAEEAFDELLAKKDLMALLYHTDSYSVRRDADEDSKAVATLQIGQTLYIQGVTITEDDVWYRAQFWVDGAEGTGFVQSFYLAYADEDWIAWEEEYLFPILELGEDIYENTAYGMAAYSIMPYALDTSDISAFPAAYQSALRSLKNVHPNWTFVPMNTGLDFNTAVSKEMGAKSLIQKTTSNSSKGWVGAACPSESGWYYATQPAVAYHMDPRNFLTETYIFQFEQLTFNSSYHTESAVQTFLNGTFMKGQLADDSAGRTYAKAFYEIGKNRKLSPIHLASRVYQEQGAGTSGLISGTYPGYQGYYNFFNVGVNGSSTAEKIVKGLTYAKEKGWNTRYKSLEGGAATIGNNYILKYQDTIYLEKFNVDKNSPYGVYNHQYMQNIQAPGSESSSTKKMYTNAGSLNSAFVFKIPVYNNMPDGELHYPTLRLNKTSLTMNKGTEQQLILYVDEIAADPSEAKEWKSSDDTVASVEEGIVKAVRPGETVITAFWPVTAKEFAEVSCKVTVQAPLQSISLDKTLLRLRRPDTVAEDITGLGAAEIVENTDTAILQVDFDPVDTTADKSITWTSSNAKIAAVKADPADSSRAVVTAVGTGTAKITAKAAKAGGQTAVCQVEVIAPICRAALTDPNAPEGAERTELFAGQSVSLNAEYWPKDTTSDNTITWRSSKEAVATVKNGRVTAKGAGSAEITAEVAGYKASYTVSVEACTVIFRKTENENDTSVMEKRNLSYGESIGKLPQESALEGKIFAGWYTKPGGMGSVFTENTRVYTKEAILYPHYEETGKGFYVIPVGDQTYTGSVIKPRVQVFDGAAWSDGTLVEQGKAPQGKEFLQLVEGRDYTVSYKYNKNVNAAGTAYRPTITVKGKGNYAGTQYVYFDIVPKALTDRDITAQDLIAAYTGRVIKNVPTVYRDSKKLVRNTDYTLTYPQQGTGAYQTAGVYPIVITGKGGYTGKITIYERITKDVLLSKVSVARIPNQTYSNGQMAEKGGIRPDALTVTYQRRPLVEGQDYTLSYSADQTIGKATVTLTAVEGSGYAGSRSVTYQIVGTSIARAKVEGLVNREYTGSEEDVRQDSYALTLNGVTLAESEDGGLTGDYVVSYTNTGKVGTATIVFKGINEYTGQLKKAYRITNYNISLDENGQNRAITMEYYTQDKPEQRVPVTELSEIETPYVKGGSKPVVILFFNGIELAPGKDYTIRYANNNTVTTEDMAEKRLPRITITGRGNLKGSIAGSFAITDGQMRNKVTMTLKDVVYRNRKNAYKSSVIVQDCNGSRLAAGRDYDRNLLYTYAEAIKWNNSDGSVIFGEADGKEISEDAVCDRKAGDPVEAGDIPPVGTAIRVTAHGIGAYAGTGEDAECSAVYRITAADLARVRVKAAAQSYQDGRPVKLTGGDLTLTVSGVAEPLICGTDYEILESTYQNNIRKGTAKVTLRGIGNYGGEKTITYTIGAKTLWWWK